jgi:hypothetical protein
LELAILPGNEFARWSSNQVCLGIFSSISRNIEVGFDYISGPDLPIKKNWIASKGLGQRLTVRDNNSSVKIELPLSQGWNLLQVKQPGCYLRQLPSRWDSRADDRSLCFLLGDVRIKGN